MTSSPYDEQWASATVAVLEERGVAFARGLAEADVVAARAAFGCPMPPELEVLLRTAVPVSAKWARWADGAEVVASEAREWIHHAFAFDIEHNDYWHAHLGPRPENTADAVGHALAVVAAAPPLFPVFAHRFLTSHSPGPRAVLSVWQAGDSIFYGNDLADYLATEFRIERPAWSADATPRVPVWEDLFDLFGEGNGDTPR